MILFYLIAGHALCDFALQSDAMAKGKNPWGPMVAGVPWYYWMAAHSLIHGGMVALITGSLLVGIAETIVHFWLDAIKCDGSLSIHGDQVLHVISKVLWFWISK